MGQLHQCEFEFALLLSIQMWHLCLLHESVQHVCPGSSQGCLHLDCTLYLTLLLCLGCSQCLCRLAVPTGNNMKLCECMCRCECQPCVACLKYAMQQGPLMLCRRARCMHVLQGTVWTGRMTGRALVQECHDSATKVNTKATSQITGLRPKARHQYYTY